MSRSHLAVLFLVMSASLNPTKVNGGENVAEEKPPSERSFHRCSQTKEQNLTMNIVFQMIRCGSECLSSLTFVFTL